MWAITIKRLVKMTSTPKRGRRLLQKLDQGSKSPGTLAVC